MKTFLNMVWTPGLLHSSFHDFSRPGHLTVQTPKQPEDTVDQDNSDVNDPNLHKCFFFILSIIIHADHVVQSAWILFSPWMYVCMLAL